MRKRSTVAPHRQMRGIITRQELLHSAREIFARDGFEHARLEDIAANIGKTRGALYDNFENKEDVFYAIFEQDIERDRAALAPMLAAAPTLEKKIAVLVKYLLGVSRDRQRMLLNLEFKLYAIRHPRERQRLANLHDAMCLQIPIPELNEVLRQLGRKTPRTRRIGCLAIGGILDGLVLSHLFDPEVLDAKELERNLKLCLNEMLRGSDTGRKKGGRDAEAVEGVSRLGDALPVSVMQERRSALRL
jgi:AcrR family transcriptional regulator